LLRSALHINKLDDEQKKKLEAEINSAEQSLDKLKRGTSQEARKFANHQNYRKCLTSYQYNANYTNDNNYSYYTNTRMNRSLWDGRGLWYFFILLVFLSTFSFFFFWVFV